MLDFKRTGQAMREQRIQAGLTQASLGEKIGYDQQAISAWELGKYEPDVGTFYILADLYDCTLEDLIKPMPHLKEIKVRRIQYEKT